MKKWLVALIMSLVPAVASPADQGDLYFSGNDPQLTQQEKAGIDIAERWKASSATGTKAVPGNNGSVQFIFGDSQPSIVCAVLQVCDVALQPGEQVNNINVGDSRWTVEPAITGFGPDEVQHLIIKPHDVGLDTSIVVTTNRRTYHLRLRSHRTKFMPYVTFIYPDEAAKKWGAIRDRPRDEREEPQGKEYLGNLDFAYQIKGDTRWKPVRVFNDGQKTIIQMPKTMSQFEAPTLLVIRNHRGFPSLGSNPEEVMVNYRVQGDRYIVDSIFDKAILIAGVGSNQDKITITREVR